MYAVLSPLLQTLFYYFCPQACNGPLPGTQGLWLVVVTVLLGKEALHVRDKCSPNDLNSTDTPKMTQGLGSLLKKTKNKIRF